MLKTVDYFGQELNKDIVDEISKVEKDKKPTEITPKRAETNSWYNSDISKE